MTTSNLHSINNLNLKIYILSLHKIKKIYNNILIKIKNLIVIQIYQPNLNIKPIQSHKLNRKAKININYLFNYKKNINLIKKIIRFNIKLKNLKSKNKMIDQPRHSHIEFLWKKRKPNNKNLNNLKSNIHKL